MAVGRPERLGGDIGPLRDLGGRVCEDGADEVDDVVDETGRGGQDIAEEEAEKGLYAVEEGGGIGLSLLAGQRRSVRQLVG